MKTGQLSMFEEEAEEKAPSIEDQITNKAPSNSILLIVVEMDTPCGYMYYAVNSEGRVLFENRIGTANKEICEFLGVVHGLAYCFNFWCSCSLTPTGKAQGGLAKIITRKEALALSERKNEIVKPLTVDPEEGHRADCTQITTLYTRSESVIQMIQAKQCPRGQERTATRDYIDLDEAWLRTHRINVEMKVADWLTASEDEDDGFSIFSSGPL